MTMPSAPKHIRCYQCHHVVAVEPASDHVGCPACGAVNAVVTPVPVQYSHAHPAYAGQAAPKNDSRRGWVAVAFVVLGVVALVLKWWGFAAGLVFLAWATVGAFGWGPGPMNLVFPKARKGFGLSMAGLSLGSLVTMCGAMGGMAEDKAAEQRAQQAEDQARSAAAQKLAMQEEASKAAAARVAREQELRTTAQRAAAEYDSQLKAVGSLVARGKWTEADQLLANLTPGVTEYRALAPVPTDITPLLPRFDELASTLAARRFDQTLVEWTTLANSIVKDKTKCEESAAVATALEQLESLDPPETHRSFAVAQKLKSELERCRRDMPPPTQWIYDLHNDQMGGRVGTASVQSSNRFEFDFPYQGAQHATLTTARRSQGDRLDVIVRIERGQFMCSLDCAVTVRFDDGKPQRWGAVGPADHSTEVIFLGSESRFLSQLKRARVVRIQASFFQEGSHVLTFPVARFREDTATAR